MKLYKLSQNDNNNYDTYDSCIVCAENEKDAITISPDGFHTIEEKYEYTSWARDVSAITCEEIGEANEKQVRGVVLASFNAG
jgi:hypothetical protein